MRVQSVVLVAWLLSAVTMAEVSRSDDWPLWRGPKMDGVSHETGLPTRFSKTENVVWRLPLPGPAGSTPVMWGDRIYLTSAENDKLVVMAVNKGGKELWKQVMAGGNKAIRFDEGNMASPSPSTDGKHVWAMMSGGELACYTVDGQPVWNLNLQELYGKFSIFYGLASSPVLDGDKLYVQLFHSNAHWVLALDKLTGKEVWKQQRMTDARVGTECEQAYASPVVYREGGLELLLTHGCDYIVALGLNDGAEIWRCGGLNSQSRYNAAFRLVATPVAAPGLVVVPSAKNGPVLGINPAGKGDLTENREAHVWSRADKTPDVPSPLIVDGLVYLCREDGTLLCLDATTGEEYYLQRGHSDRHRASPVYADGKIFLTARDGTVTVVKPGKKFEILSSNDMEESISSSPAIAHGRIYLRSFDALYAIGLK